MEDTIEVCTGCGKMPRPLDRMEGSFTCSRCGNKMTMHVKSENYETVVSDLDRKFHENVLKERHEAVSSEPIELVKSKPAKKASAKKSPAKKASKPAKKSKAKKR